MASSVFTRWKNEAKCEQIQSAKMFNKMDICPFDVLKTRLAVCLYGLPEKIRNNLENNNEWDDFSYGQYNKQQQNVVEELSQCILQHQKLSNKDEIFISFVLVLLRTKKEDNFQDWVFKVPGKPGRSITFIDRNCRIYKDWNDYLKNNTLPKATICYPVDGKYADEECSVRVDYAHTPSCSVAKDVLFGFDIGTSVTALVMGGVSTASLFIPFAAPIVWTAFGVSVAAGAYGAGRSIESLVDRGMHEETLSPLNSHARSAWLGATVPFFGIAAGSAAAVAATAKVATSISQAGRMAINVTNGVNCVAHAVCFVNDVYNIIETSINGNEVSKMQIYQCIASLLLFSNAVVSTYQARLILQSLSSRETAGGIETFFGKLSLTRMTENGVIIRPTNFVSTVNISGLISVAIPWGGMLLNIPPMITKCIENIFHFLMKNKNSDFPVIAVGLLPLLKKLWEQMQEQTKKHSYHCEGPKTIIGSCTKSKSSIIETEEKEKISKNVNSSTSVNSSTDEKKETESHKITILNMDWEGEQEPFQKIIKDMLKKEDVSELDVLHFSQLIFQRLKGDLEDKEKHFKTMCRKNPSLSEKQLEEIIGINGKRSQHFADEIMKSYKDIKIIALKQDCQRLIEENGMQIPLYSSFGSPINIQYYHSIQKHGTKTQKFLKILEKAKIIIRSEYSTYFPSENSCFVELCDPHSKYNMAGIVNFAGDIDMMGIIILQEKN